MIRRLVRIGETIATVMADEPFVALAEVEIRRQRRALEDYISSDPDFLTAIEPRPARADAPPIVRRMAAAASRTGVGPMAAVAGAVAEFAVKAMADAGADHAVVDNGGDLALLLSHPLTVGIFAGQSQIRDIGFRLQPLQGIFGVCTSSGTVGHSLSFGRADAAVVVADDVCLADAAATALANSIQNENDEHIRSAMQRSLIEGIDGAMAIIGDAMGTVGNLPEIVNVRMDMEKISK